MNIFHVMLYLLLIHLSFGKTCPQNYLQIFLNFFYPFSEEPDIELKYNTDILPDNSISSNLYIPIQHYPILFHPDSSRRKSFYYDSYPTVLTRRALNTDSSPSDLSRRGFHPGIFRFVSPHRPFPTSASSYNPISTSATSVSTRPISSPTDSDTFNPTTHKNWKLLNDDKCGSSSENRIVGGVNASLGQYPWIARIGYSADRNDKNITFKCGGTLISKSHILTAAHCTINLPDSFQVTQVRLGEYDTTKDIDCIGELCAEPHHDYAVEHILVHKFYGEPKNANDIALIKLDNVVQITEWIAPICMPFGSLLTKKLVGSKVDIAGWGYFDVTIPNGSTILQTVKLPVLPNSICVRKFKRYTISNKKQICVGGIIGKDSCNGDSGGPLMKVEVEAGEGPKYYLFGIVSFGATYCGLSTSPAVYTNVASYLEWILENLSLK